jgi:energy-coupling factor transporter ATP-binding protein EcfA2
MRKLTVKNFSVIKEAELEFGKITVLIGPQTSGKSLLCKLAYFLERETIELAVRSLVSLASLGAFKSILKTQFIRRFAANSGLGRDASIAFSAHHFAIELSWEDFEGNEEVKIDFSPEFQAEYSDLFAACSSQNVGGGIQRNFDQDNIRVRLNLLLGEGFTFDTYYIPAGRAFFTNVALGINALRNPDIDPIVSEFATTIAWNTNRVSLSSEDAKRALWEIAAKMVEIAGGRVEGTSDSPVFVTKDKRRISFPLLSSGTQELLPMFNVLARLASDREKQVVFIKSGEPGSAFRRLVRSKKLIYLEEPEAHIFPETQRQLVQLFAWLSSEPTQDFSWIITTHSPYTLSSFNNLIYAGQLATQKPELKNEISALVPEHFWVEDGSLRAYCIHDGALKSILSESGLIDGEYLDSVSSNIGNEFDSLLRLEYENTKAS